MARPGRLACLWAFLLLGSAATAHADFFSSSPGPLARAHAKLDAPDRCQDCHVGARGLGPDKCLKCHEPIAERQRQHEGVHASPKALGRPCEICHTEHKGRERDILGFVTFGGQARFDHAGLTRFALAGKHQSVACKDCHTQRTPSGTVTYLKAPAACAGCHQSPHGDLREPLRRCERCHDARSWHQLASSEFDHGRDTRYPLERKHESLPCAACHATRRGGPPNARDPIPPTNAQGYQKLTFRWPTWSTDCTPCHDNVHGAALFGQKPCKLCHSARVELTRVAFDHNRRTHFPLEGAHADAKKAPCASCHQKGERQKPERRCLGCHADVHKERFAKVSGGNDCGACHAATRWRGDLGFDHNARTRFGLTGAHANADCRACHRGKGPTDWESLTALVARAPSGRGTQVACMGCHRHENAHQRQYGNERCLECHKLAGVVTTKPRAINEFHGPSSRFPLTEGHKGVECARCHPNNVFSNTPLACGPRCHPDELHKGTLGNDCLGCHSGGRWEARKFDHDTKTHWPLVGNHKDVSCEACHPRRDFAANQDKGRHCFNCHAKDDAHAGQLGRLCERCHSPNGVVSFEHNDARVSDWPLRGQHGKVRCAACHATIHFKPTPRDCGGCHAEPDVHKGQLGTLCASCHVETAWKLVKTGHDVPTPRFGGAHDRVPCAQCHAGGRLLAGTAQLCITCHRNDDIHHNALGPRCGECHTQRTWAGARFDHTRVGCELVGVHRLLPCADCHVGGNYTALSPTCASCHFKERARGNAKGTVHNGFTTCANCHNTVFFNPQVAAPGQRESVCR